MDGISIFDAPIAAAAKIGYLPEQNPLYNEMIVLEALKYVADLRGMSKAFFKERKDFVIEKCGLEQVKYQKAGTLSKGYRQRLGLAQAILHDPEILILDEPTSGLDPNQILDIRQLIKDLGREKTVLLSSHILQEVQAVCDRVLIIHKGQLIVDDEISKLDAYFSEYQDIHLELEGEDIDFSEFLDYHPDLQLLYEQRHNDHYSVQFRADSSLDIKQDLSRFILENGWLVLELFSRRKSLEEIFHQLTRTELNGLKLHDEAAVEPETDADADLDIVAADSTESTEKAEAEIPDPDAATQEETP